MTVSGETLYVVDGVANRIFTLPTSLDGPVGELDLGGLDGFSMFGSIVAWPPDRLLVTEASDPTEILVLERDTGIPRSRLTLNRTCPCSADLDADGDVDSADESVLTACTDQYYQAFGECVVADIDCDGFLGGVDQELLACQFNGPDQAPNDGCCPNDLPDLAARATGLASIFPHVLLAGDWNRCVVREFDTQGRHLGASPLNLRIGTMGGGRLGTFADADGDSDVDLLDWAVTQTCFTGADATFTNSDCRVFDYDLDTHVDLNDYVFVNEAFTGATR